MTDTGVDYVVKHKGIVTAVSHDGTAVDLRLADNSHDCGGCALHGLCSPGGKTDSVIITADTSGRSLKVGDMAEVGLPDRTRWFASAVVLIVPVVIFVVTLLTAIALGQTEGLAAVMAIVLTALYFTALLPLRGRMSRHSHWQVISG